MQHLPAGVTEIPVDDLSIIAIRDVISAAWERQLQFHGSIRMEIWIAVEEGNEIALSSEFPCPELFELLRHELRIESLAQVELKLHSWQDPACELEQGAWVIVVKT